MIRLALSLCLLALSLPAAGDDATPKVTAKKMDEITVMGARALGELRAELIRAEDEVYELFNELNGDDDYDIICKMEAPIGSQIKRRNCKARLYRRTLSEITRDEEDAAVIVGRVVNQEKHNQILRDKMRDVANQNPQLISALRKRLDAQRKLEAEKSGRYGHAGN